jgi:hypothetical protein
MRAVHASRNQRASANASGICDGNTIDMPTNPSSPSSGGGSPRDQSQSSCGAKKRS